ncbi:hypothetical protein M422DRAFT_53108 [Sphaerobolus stellatus SS14]|uniref:Uncharacterized protein n=1 Tax=Sphaerobolus stellatus (strain SS14) TaxID=990650 RepID=A0A0C9UBS4_SPHS4|nr:hypothetical protein M422DRAFT_53108 [Sphaerobolus stellatus SS14]
MRPNTLFNKCTLVLASLLFFNAQAQSTTLYFPGETMNGTDILYQAQAIGETNDHTTYLIKLVDNEPSLVGNDLPFVTLVEGPSDLSATYTSTATGTAEDSTITQTEMYYGFITCGIKDGQSTCTQALSAVSADSTTTFGSSVFTEAVSPITAQLVSNLASVTAATTSGSPKSTSSSPTTTGTTTKNSSSNQGISSIFIAVAAFFSSFGIYLL